jgi:hypothetical protein
LVIGSFGAAGTAVLVVGGAEAGFLGVVTAVVVADPTAMRVFSCRAITRAKTRRLLPTTFLVIYVAFA